MKAGETIIPAAATCGLGELRIKHPSDTSSVTPATLVALEAIGRHQAHLSGIGIDWGSGSGALAILCAKIAAVTRVVGLEIEPANVDIARLLSLIHI